MSTNNMDQQIFNYFPKLPPEIRVMVWQEFLRRESSSRYIYSKPWARWGPRFVPDANLVSPLLNVTTESRAAALKFYITKLAVYETYMKRSEPPLPDGLPDPMPDGPMFSFFPKGYIYLRVPLNHFKTNGHQPNDDKILLPAETHPTRNFAKNDPEAYFIGLSTEEIFDDYPKFGTLITRV